MNENINSIMDILNGLFNSFFNSIDDTVVNVIDSLMFLDTSIIEDHSIQKILGTGNNIGTVNIALSLITGIVIYYASRNLISKITNERIETTTSFIYKISLNGILIIFSYQICYMIIDSNYILTEGFKSIGTEITGNQINFKNFIEIINKIIGKEDNLQMFSIDGVLKGFLGYGMLNLLFMYSLRLIYLKILCILSPFAILLKSTEKTKEIFVSWLKSFFGLLFLQNLIVIVMIILFSINVEGNSLYNKIIAVGSIYALVKLNDFMKEVLGSFSVNINTGGILGK